jgi:formyltetrahydrofolate-dependent phosphoribosylglycinamide formyltransferase
MYKIACFVSGNGSNLKAIFEEIAKGNLLTEISLVVSNKSDCNAVKFAEVNALETFIIAKDSSNYSELINILLNKKIDLIVLAGFLKKIPDFFVDAFPNKIINIHPALLPSFGGKGMYGLNVHKAVFDSSVKVSGPTVHFVNNNYDEGLIISQSAVDINDVKSPEEIAAKVLNEEHKILPFVIRKFSENKVRIIGSRVIID